MYTPNLKQFPNPKPAKNIGQFPELDRKRTGMFYAFQGLHEDGHPGYPATSAAWAIGRLLGVGDGEGEVVYRIMVRWGLTQEGDHAESIRKTVLGNATKDHRKTEQKGVPHPLAPQIQNLCKATEKVVREEMETEVKEKKEAKPKPKQKAASKRKAA